MNDLVPIKAARTTVSLGRNLVIPAAIAGAGDKAVRRFLEFFAATIRNRNTREAYYRATCLFFAWLERNGTTELDDIEPMHVSLYIEALQATAAKPTVKLHLAAIRHLFDWLVIGQILPTNPAHAVRRPKHIVRRGKTPFLTEDQARRLLAGLDTSTLVGMRDRAVIGLMTYTFARIGAVVGMRVEDYFPGGKRFYVRLHEKGGKQHEMPVHHKLEEFLDEYIKAASIAENQRGPLFRTAAGRTGSLTENAMHRVDAYRMIRRRTAEAGFKVKLGCHTFRATGLTTYLDAGGTLESAQAMAAHESPKTAKLCDRTDDEITLDEVERVRI